MPNILSQEEVDALLGALERGESVEESGEPSGREKKVAKYDFRRPDRSYFRDQLRFFQSIHETFAQQYASALSVYLRSIVEIDPLSTDQRTYGEYILELPRRSSLFVFDVDPLEGHCVLEMHPSLILTMIDRLFGGTGSQADFSRDLTDIEKAVMNKLVQRGLSVLAGAWESVTKLTPSLQTYLNSPAALQLLPESESVVLSTFEVRMGEASGMMSVCYPHLTLEPIIPQISSSRGISRRRIKDVPEGPKWISSGLEETRLPLAVELGCAELSVREFLDLRQGDVIALDQRVDKAVQVKIGNKVKAKARPGLRGTHRVVRVEEFEPGWMDSLGAGAKHSSPSEDSGTGPATATSEPGAMPPEARRRTA